MKGWNPEEWHQQMYAEVAVAYRLSELGSLSEDGPYDPNDIKEIDTEFHTWLNEVKARERKETEQRIIKLLEEIYYDFGEINPIGQWAMRKAMNAIDPGGFISPRSEIKGENK